MPEVLGTGVREDFAGLEQALAAPDAAWRREELKAGIIGLFRTVDRELAALADLKERVKGLAQRWKELDAGAPAEAGTARPSAPTPTAPVPVSGPRRADHLNASTFIEKGWSQLALGDHRGAESTLQRALELAPDDPQALSLRGWTLMLQERYDDALLDFQRVLMQEPQNSLARINVGFICLKKRIFGEAIEHLSRAIRLDNDRKATLYAHYYLGLLYLERGMFEDAQVFFEKSIRLGPNLVEAHYELGRALWFGGDRDAARQAWRDGAVTNKFNPWSRRCGELLAHVEAGGEPPPASSSR